MSEFDLEQSLLTGQWGFTLQGRALQPIQSGDLLSLTLPAHLARAWVVHLNAFRYASGPLVAGQPPDNQTDTSGQVRAAIQWGVDSASEQALVDYPARGATFEVQASVIRLQLTSLVNFSAAAPPLMSGFIAPAAGRGQSRFPKLTTGRNTQAQNLQVDYPIPVRAHGYRIMPEAPGNGASAFLALSQRDNAGIQVTFDGSYDYSGTFFQQANSLEPGWWPLHPQSQFVRVDTTGNTGANSFAFQFLLDLG